MPKAPPVADLPYRNAAWFKGTGHGVDHVLSAIQQEFIDWLLDPSKDKGNQAEWARERNVSPHTVTNWKTGKTFIAELDARARKVNGGTERVQRIVDAMYDKALGGDTKAMQLYLEYVDKFTPKKLLVVDDRSPSEWSDAELAAALESAAALRQGT